MVNKDNLIIKWEDIPILLSSTIDNVENDIYYNFELEIDYDTCLVYQKNIPPQDILYKYSRNSAIGKIWENHHENFYNFIIHNINLDNKEICEIGSGSGFLAKKISKTHKIDCFEPTPNFESNDNIHIIKKFFDNSDIKKYDIIILSHTLEHVIDIDNFLNIIRSKLNKNGKIVLSFPNLEKGLENNNINIFNTEHISYFTPKSTERILNKNYFQNCKILEYTDHSIFSIGELCDDNKYKKPTKKEILSITKKIKNYEKILISKIKKVDLIIKNIDSFYIFGCHAMTSIFLYFSKINQNKIIAVLDNDPLKNKNRLYGTSLICEHPKNIKPNFVLLNGSTYHNEIKKNLLDIGFNVIDWKE